MRKFGIVNETISKINPIMEPKRHAQSKDEKVNSAEIAVLRKKIEELELKLEYERLRTEALDTMIDLAEARFNIPIRKKPGAKQSRS